MTFPYFHARQMASIQLITRVLFGLATVYIILFRIARQCNRMERKVASIL